MDCNIPPWRPLNDLRWVWAFLFWPRTFFCIYILYNGDIGQLAFFFRGGGHLAPKRLKIGGVSFRVISSPMNCAYGNGRNRWFDQNCGAQTKNGPGLEKWVQKLMSHGNGHISWTVRPTLLQKVSNRSSLLPQPEKNLRWSISCPKNTGQSEAPVLRGGGLGVWDQKLVSQSLKMTKSEKIWSLVATCSEGPLRSI